MNDAKLAKDRMMICCLPAWFGQICFNGYWVVCACAKKTHQLTIGCLFLCAIKI